MLKVVAALPSLMEAQIACGALQAAGFDAQVFDQAFGGVISTDLIGGFRIVVPIAEAREAEAFLREVGASPPVD